MTSEIRLRRSPRLNNEYASSSEESDSSFDESDSSETFHRKIKSLDAGAYSELIGMFDDKIGFLLRLSKTLNFIPALYSLLNGFYFHSAVSALMLISNYYPNLSICDVGVGDASYHIGFYTYAVSQVFITTPDNMYFILFSEMGIQYGYLFYMILYLRHDYRYAHFKTFMNFFICFTKCMILYYLSTRSA
jgi:hypothetical protein